MTTGTQERNKTNVMIDRDLLKEARFEAVRREVPLYVVIEEYVRAGLRGGPKK